MYSYKILCTGNMRVHYCVTIYMMFGAQDNILICYMKRFEIIDVHYVAHLVYRFRF